MSKIVNLRTARKARRRAEARVAADVNAARHGEAKAQKIVRRMNEALERRRLEEHRRAERDGEGDGEGDGD